MSDSHTDEHASARDLVGLALVNEWEWLQCGSTWQLIHLFPTDMVADSAPYTIACPQSNCPAFDHVTSAFDSGLRGETKLVR